MTKFQARQGDIFLDQIAEIPKAAKAEAPAERVVLALGEATGHAHAFYGRGVTMFRADDGGVFIDVKEPSDLKHEEHKTVRVPKGKYRVIRQREYAPRELPRTVAD